MARQITPLDDPKRLGVLRSFEILGTQREPVFDRLVQLAAHICGTPYAAISFVDDTGPQSGSQTMARPVPLDFAAMRSANRTSLWSLTPAKTRDLRRTIW